MLIHLTTLKNFSHYVKTEKSQARENMLHDSISNIRKCKLNLK